jgi:DNA-binding GntR family transcriptional regulator
LTFTSVYDTLTPDNRNMPKPDQSANGAGPLVKHALAERLREEIITGRLEPGSRIVEGTWGRKLGVAQASIREAINILAHETFVIKASGRSARVVNLSEQDVLQLFELRGALEGLAARLAAARDADITELEHALERMRRAAHSGNADEVLDADRQFHLELCDLSGNPHLQQHARRLLLPFFAFARMRVVATGQNTKPWDRGLDAHQRVIDLIREHEAEVAEQYVHRLMARFSATAYQDWQKAPPQKKTRATLGKK